MKLHSTILGNGQPFLILHGFLGMSDNWKTLGKKFSENGYEVHLIDQRNHGRSAHSPEFNYTVMAQDIKDYCESHSLKNIVLMGHSMGGKTAMFTASNFPDLVEKLIVVDIAPKYYKPHHQQILKGLKAIQDSSLESRGQAEEILSKYVKEKSVQMFLLKNLYWKTKGKLALRMNLPVLIEKIDNLGAALPDKARFSKPSLFLKGEKSNYIVSEDENLIKKHFSLAKIITIPHAGHWLHAENPTFTLKNVLKFL